MLLFLLHSSFQLRPETGTPLTEDSETLASPTGYIVVGLINTDPPAIYLYCHVIRHCLIHQNSPGCIAAELFEGSNSDSGIESGRFTSLK